jgi:large subunit ribosomal protein L21
VQDCRLRQGDVSPLGLSLVWMRVIDSRALHFLQGSPMGSGNRADQEIEQIKRSSRSNDQADRELRSQAEFIERADMYAVIKTGGKQYKVAAGEKIKIEQIAADVGQEITIDQVLAVGNGADLKVGTPLVAGASVKATVVAQGRHDKVRIFKMRRRKHYQKRQGHRQNFTEIEISAVSA